MDGPYGAVTQPWFRASHRLVTKHLSASRITPNVPVNGSATIVCGSWTVPPCLIDVASTQEMTDLMRNDRYHEVVGCHWLRPGFNEAFPDRELAACSTGEESRGRSVKRSREVVVKDNRNIPDVTKMNRHRD